MFLSPEEKIIYLRKKYGITQDELSSSDLTRQFIGMIEIGKRNLTPKTADLICRNFNNILKKRSINDIIEPSSLLETREEQAFVKLNTIIKTKEYQNDLEIDFYFSELNEINRKTISYLLGKFYYELNKIKISKKYYEIALFLNNPLENTDILLELTRINYYLDRFEENVEIVGNYISFLHKNYNETNIKILYNYSYSLYKTGKIDIAIKEFDYLLKQNINNDLSFKIQNMLAIIYYSKQNKIRKALNIYLKLMGVSNNENKLVIYGNYLKIWLINKKIDIEKIILELNILLDKHKTSDEHLFKIYVLLGEVYFELETKRKSYTYYLRSLKLSNNKLTLSENKYQLILDILEKFELNDKEIEELLEVFLLIYNEEKNYEMTFKIIKKIKIPNLQLFLLTKINI